MPAELVGGQSPTPNRSRVLRTIPGWVVEALRRHRDEGWPLPTPRIRRLGTTQRDGPLDIAHYINGAYGDFFRRGSDTSDLEDISLDTHTAARHLHASTASRGTS